MPTKKQTESQNNQHDNHKPQPTPASTQGMGEMAGADLTSMPMLSAAGDMTAQASRLGDGRFSVTQRQMMAEEMAQMQGNQHMLRVLGSVGGGVMGAPVMQMKAADSTGLIAHALPQIQRELSAEEQAKVKEEKDKFLAESFTATNNIPSTGIGKFDASYDPKSGQMKVTIRIFFDFVAATDASMWDFLSSPETQWSEDEKANYVSEFVGGVASRWSGQHQMSCSKPNWEEFTVKPTVSVQPTGDPGAAHFQVKVHKLSKASKDIIDKNAAARPRDEVHNPDDPTKEQGTADFYEGDTEMRKSNEMAVTKEEVQRLKDALASSGANPTTFAPNDGTTPNNQGALTAFGQALSQTTPSAPQIPIKITGWIGDGDTENIDTLKMQRAEAVAMAIVKANNSGLSPVQPSAGDTLMNKPPQVTISIGDTAINTNQRRVTDHEVGHMLGLPDEYAEGPAKKSEKEQALEEDLQMNLYNAKAEKEAESHEAIETSFKQQVTSAGLDMPAMGKDTSSIMSTGVDVLPAHYVTLKEVLGRMTSKYISDSQWQIKG